jgi:hypothetical protein
MKRIRVLMVILVFGISAFVSGCGGGGAEVTNTSTTMGQELSDLQKAKDQGVIDDKEFEKAKKAILERY